MGMENIVAGNGIGIAITGMLIVFAGLTLISGFVAVLPRIAGTDVRRPRVQAADAGVMGQEPSLALDPDLLAAIGYVVEAEWLREQTMDRQRITMEEPDEQQVWTAIGKMRTLSTRL
ncbi:MAG: OadG family protein [Gemmatimonadota bacterium]